MSKVTLNDLALNYQAGNMSLEELAQMASEVEGDNIHIYARNYLQTKEGFEKRLQNFLKYHNRG